MADSIQFPVAASVFAVAGRQGRSKFYPGHLLNSLIDFASDRNAKESHFPFGFNALSIGQKKRVQQKWGRYLETLNCLSHENNAQLFYQSLFHLGERLEGARLYAQAGQIYSLLLNVKNIDQEMTEFPSLSILARAQKRFDVLRGVGDVFEQVEHIAKNFVDQVSDPAFLLSATAVGLLGRWVQLSSLRYLYNSTAVNLFTRGPLAAPAAALLGFAVEATSFPIALKGSSYLFRREVEWDHIRSDMLGAYCFLGGMRLGGFGGKLWAALPGHGPLTRAVLPIFTSLIGITLGTGAEVLFHLRDPQPLGNFVISVLGTWATLEGAGLVSKKLFGAQIEDLHEKMKLQTEVLARRHELPHQQLLAWAQGKTEKLASSLEDFFGNSGSPPFAVAGLGSMAIPTKPVDPLQEGRAYATGDPIRLGGVSDEVLASLHVAVLRLVGCKLEAFDMNLRRFAEAYPFPVAIARLEPSLSKLGGIDIINSSFSEGLHYTANQIKRYNLTHFFNIAESFHLSGKILALIRGVLAGRPGIFSAQRMQWRLPEEGRPQDQFTWVTGRGVVVKLHHQTIGFGFLTDINSAKALEFSTSSENRLAEQMIYLLAYLQPRQSGGLLEYTSLIELGTQLRQGADLMQSLRSHDLQVKIVGKETTELILRRCVPELLHLLNASHGPFVPDGRRFAIELAGSGGAPSIASFVKARGFFELERQGRTEQMSTTPPPGSTQPPPPTGLKRGDSKRFRLNVEEVLRQGAEATQHIVVPSSPLHPALAEVLKKHEDALDKLLSNRMSIITETVGLTSNEVQEMGTVLLEHLRAYYQKKNLRIPEGHQLSIMLMTGGYGVSTLRFKMGKDQLELR